MRSLHGEGAPRVLLAGLIVLFMVTAACTGRLGGTWVADPCFTGEFIGTETDSGARLLLILNTVPSREGGEVHGTGSATGRVGWELVRLTAGIERVGQAGGTADLFPPLGLASTERTIPTFVELELPDGAIECADRRDLRVELRTREGTEIFEMRREP